MTLQPEAHTILIADRPPELARVDPVPVEDELPALASHLRDLLGARAVTVTLASIDGWMRTLAEAGGCGGASAEWNARGPCPSDRIVVEAARTPRSRIFVTCLFADASAADAAATHPAMLGFKPLLAASLRLWLLHHESQQLLRIASTALLHARHGIVGLNARAEIIFENDAARTILDRGKPLERRRNSIAANGTFENARLGVAIDRALAPGRTCAARDDPFILLKVARQSSPLLLRVFPLGGGMGGGMGGAAEAGAVIHIHDPVLPDEEAILPVCRWYGLTRTETKLVTLLLSGQSAPEIAETQNIKQDTIRTYLKSVFRKTQTRSQADLIRVVMMSLMPASRRTDERRKQNKSEKPAISPQNISEDNQAEIRISRPFGEYLNSPISQT